MASNGGDVSGTPKNPVKVGVYCLRGAGHWACYDEEDASACGTKGPDVYIDVDLADYAMYPEWLQRVIDFEFQGIHSAADANAWD